MHSPIFACSGGHGITSAEASVATTLYAKPGASVSLPRGWSSQVARRLAWQMLVHLRGDG